MTFIKRAFGLIAVLTGLALIVVGLGHPLFPKGELSLGALFGGVGVGVVFVSAGRRWLMNEVDLDLVNVDVGDPRIIEAARLARTTLPTFWSFLEQGRHECYVKFPLQMRSGNVEHVWGVVHSRSDDRVVVSMASTPVEDPLQTDGRITVDVSQIEDWQVIIGPDEIRGGYSVGALAEVARSRGFRLGRKSRRVLAAFRDLQPGHERSR